MNALKKLLITGLGTGYLPVAPGTWGSAAVAVIFLLVAWGADGRGYCVTGTMVVVMTVASVLCVALGPAAEKLFGRKDPSHCTIDEWAGQALTFALLPVGGGWAGRLTTAAVGFVAFRVMDILKPPPARQLEKLPHGWGVLLDDLMAGLYANLLCQLALRVILPKLA